MNEKKCLHKVAAGNNKTTELLTDQFLKIKTISSRTAFFDQPETDNNKPFYQNVS